MRYRLPTGVRGRPPISIGYITYFRKVLFVICYVVIYSLVIIPSSLSPPLLAYPMQENTIYLYKGVYTSVKECIFRVTG